MDFAEALKAMKLGNKVSREAWRGKISYLKIAKDDQNDELIVQFYPNGKLIPAKHLQRDVLADDWWIVT